MIGRVYRGDDTAGLVRYLFGPGRHNEHVDQRLVASWRGNDRQALKLLEPAAAADGVDRAGLSRLSDLLDVPSRAAERPEKAPVWHCPLRVAPGDRTLSDDEWADVAADLMNRTGIARRDDPDGCRWVAVRHDEESIHVVAVLAREDGRAVKLWNDHRRVRETCLAAEERYGLHVTAPADQTTAVHTSRQERERAARQGKAVPDREWLRTQAQHAAATSRAPVDFLDRLRTAGVAVRERRDPQTGDLTGYAVARPGTDGPELFYGGGKLAADLSLPKLTSRWADSASPYAAAGPGDPWEQATASATAAVEVIRGAVDAGSPEAGEDAAAAAADLFAVTAQLVGDDPVVGVGVGTVAAVYDRAAREPYRRTPQPSTEGRALRTAALRLSFAAATPQARQVALLLLQMQRLTQAVVELREAQGRLAQANAARRAQGDVTGVAARWVHEAGGAGQPQAATRQQVLQRAQHAAQQPAAAHRDNPTPPDRGRGR